MYAIRSYYGAAEQRHDDDQVRGPTEDQAGGDRITSYNVCYTKLLRSPYAFNMPPRPWAGTLRAINELDYDLLVPGHGPVQRDRAYINLLIEVADSIADQRDTLVNQGYEGDELAQALDFSEFEERFTGGDEYILV